MSEKTEDIQAQQRAEAEKLVARADDLLMRHARPADAAGTYSQALQLAPYLVAAHLGMAKANFALGAFSIARAAADYVQRLAPGTRDAQVAQALLQAMDRQFDAALATLDALVHAEPGLAYAHALRGYCLRQQRRDYDASLAEAKAARLASSPDVRPLFPRVDLAPPAPFAPSPFAPAGSPTVAPPPMSAPPPMQPYQRHTPARRQMIRLSFALRGYPVATFSLIAVCVLVFLAQVVTGGNLLDTSNSSVTYQGLQINPLITQDGQWWRLVTTIFLHAGIVHIFFNMLSLYFIGPMAERLFGTGRFLALFFVTGIVASLAFLVAVPNGAALGASGAIAGIFGALGAYFFAFRGRIGPAANGMIQWWFTWLLINVAFNIYDATGLAWQAHLGGLVSGFVLGLLLARQRLA